MNKSILLTLGLLLSFQMSYAIEGGVAGGGGNTVTTSKGDQLFDDYVVAGSTNIPSEQIAKLAEPYLKDLRKKVPTFAEKLEASISAVTWYREEKLLSQSGVCLNGSDTGLTPTIEQKVRACQNKLEIRIEKEWFDTNLVSHPELVAGLVIHELLVFQRIRSPKIIEAGVFRISRDVRSLSMSAEDLQKELRLTEFGKFDTAVEAAHTAYKSAESDILQICLMEYHSPQGHFTPSRAGFDSSVKVLNKRVDILEGKPREIWEKRRVTMNQLLKVAKAKRSLSFCDDYPTSLVEQEDWTSPVP